MSSLTKREYTVARRRVLSMARHKSAMSNSKHKTTATTFKPATGSKPERDLLRWQRAIFVSQIPEVRTFTGPLDGKLHRLVVTRLKEAGLVADTTNPLDVNVGRLLQMARLLIRGASPPREDRG